MRGPAHRLVAAGLVNHGKVLLAQRKLADAARQCRAAWAIYEQTTGLDTRPGVACVEVLGRVRAAQGQTAEAEALLRRALEARRALTGLMHPAVADVLTALAQLNFDCGRCRQADSLCRAALEVYESKLSPNAGRKLAPALRCAAAAARALGDPERAEALAARLRTLESPSGGSPAP
ncbi:MAG: tetratricopeptide repeat protein [Planctomycetia bacterium]|nr:tetratricopeptide repeat protein [Planctomycetia bacterium]